MRKIIVSKEVFNKFLEGDNTAVTEVYSTVRKLMFFVISTYISNVDECNEILDESFISLFENRKKIKSEKDLKSFAVTLSKFKALDYLKKNNCFICEYIDEMYGQSDNTDNLINDLCNVLSNKEAIVVIYRAVYSLSWKEINEITGIPNSSLRFLYKKAVDVLKEKLK